MKHTIPCSIRNDVKSLALVYKNSKTQNPQLFQTNEAILLVGLGDCGLSLRCPFWAPTCATWTGLPMTLKLADLITSLLVISKASDQLISDLKCIPFRSPTTLKGRDVDEG